MEKFFDGIEIAPEIKQTLIERISAELSEKEKLASVNANRILDSVASTITSKFGVERDIQKYPKITDFLTFATEQIGNNSVKKAELILSEKENKIKELESKIASGLTDEKFKKEYESLQQKYGQLSDTLENEKKRIKDIENEYNGKLYDYQFDSVIANSMPEIDKNANPFEVKERKKEAITKIKKEYELKQNENGEIVLQNKQTFSTAKNLSELLTEELAPILVKKETKHVGQTPPQGTNAVLNFSGLSGIEIDNLITSNIFATTDIKSKIDPRFAPLFKKKMDEGMKNMQK